MNDKDRNRQIADMLRKARIRAGISTEDAAKRLGFSTVSLSRMETGSAMLPAVRLEGLARYYGVSVSDLLDGELVTMPTTVDKARMKAAIVLVQQIIRKLRVSPSPEKVADGITRVYETEIDRLIRDSKADTKFDPDHHTEFVEMFFKR